MHLGRSTTRIVLTTVSAAAIVASGSADAGADANYAPRPLWASLTAVPAPAAPVPVSTGRVSTVRVAFHAGAAVAGRLYVTGAHASARDIRVVVVSKSTHHVVGTAVTGGDGSWQVGGLPPEDVYVCADGSPKVPAGTVGQPSEYEFFGARCLGSEASWPDASHQADITRPDVIPGSIEDRRPDVTDVPADAVAVRLQTGKVAMPTLHRSMTLPQLASIHAQVTDAPGADNVYYFLFDSTGRVVTYAYNAATESAVFPGLAAGRYRVCAIVGNLEGDVSQDYSPVCDGGVPWSDAVFPAGEKAPPPPPGTRVLTVADVPDGGVPAGAPATYTSFAALPGSAITGHVHVPPAADGGGQAFVYLYAGSTPMTSTHVTPANSSFAFHNLPERDDWRICAIGATSGGGGTADEGQCWTQVPYPDDATAPPDGATPIATQVGRTTGGIDLSVSAAPPSSTTSPPAPPARRAVTVSGTVRQVGGSALQGAVVTLFRLRSTSYRYELVAYRRTDAAGRWSFPDQQNSSSVYAGDRIQACAGGPTAHPRGRAVPVGTYVVHCGTPFVARPDARGRQDGIDFTLQRGGAVLGLLTAGGANWGGSIAVAERGSHTVVQHNFSAGPRSGRAIASGVAASSGYDVCFVPDDRYTMSYAHPTGLLPQCANGRDWYGSDADYLPYVDNVDPIE